MAFNGSGTFSLIAGNPVVSGTTISSTWANNTLVDIATNGLTNCITKDGQTTVTANIPFGGFRLTNIGAASATTDAARASQVQNSSMTALTGVSGTSTITASATPTPAAYAEGQRFAFTALGANGASPTLNVSGLGAALIYWHMATCTASMWSAQDRIEVAYLAASVSTASATGFHLVGHSGFMPANLLRTKGAIASGIGNGNAEISAPTADDQVLCSTASASAGVAWKSPNAVIATASASACGILGVAVQANMEAATAVNLATVPANQQYHPGHPKAWGLITPATTVTASYPSAGVSVVNGSTANYTVTHGLTFSSVNYAVVITPALASAVNFSVGQVTAKNQTTFSVQFFDQTAAQVVPAFFSYVLYGDL